jgi:hypothetical protein
VQKQAAHRQGHRRDDRRRGREHARRHLGAIQEFESGDWAIGGKALQSSDVRALAAGKAA